MYGTGNFNFVGNNRDVKFRILGLEYSGGLSFYSLLENFRKTFVRKTAAAYYMCICNSGLGVYILNKLFIVYLLCGSP